MAKGMKPATKTPAGTVSGNFGKNVPTAKTTAVGGSTKAKRGK